MKFLSLEQALIIAAEVTGLSVETVARSARLDLLDSALATPDCEESSVAFMLDVAAGTMGVDETVQWLHARLSERGAGEQ